MKRLISVVLCLVVAGCSSTKKETVVETAIKTSPASFSSGGNLKLNQRQFVVKQADLTFKIVPSTQSISASANLNISHLTQQKSIELDFDSSFIITRIMVGQQSISKDNYSSKNGMLRIYLPEPKQAGEHSQVNVDYHGQPHVAERAPWNGGFVWSTTESGHPWIATAVQAEGCDLFWPCVDHPTGEPLNLNLFIDVPKPLVAASNGVLQSVKDNGESRVYHWQSFTAMNNYAVSLNVGPFQLIESYYQSQYGNQIDMVFYHLPKNKDKATALFQEFTPMLTFFEKFIGPYPFAKDKMGVVETPHLGMEHQTMNAYGNDYKVNEFGFDWLLHHEFAHEWFGNQLTNFDWRDMWLHEGFATYMQPLYAQYLHGDMAYMAQLFKTRASIKNAYPIASYENKIESDVYDRKNGPGLDIYHKGAHVLHTLRYLIGDEAFFSAVQKLVYGENNPVPGAIQPRYGNTDEFIQFVNEASDSELQWFFDVYLYQAELPELKVTEKKSYMTFEWITPEGLPFPMPLEVSINGETRRLTMTDIKSLLVDEDDVVVVDPHGKILRHAPHIERFQQAQNDIDKTAKAN